MKWFKHDSAASMDAKLRKVRAKYGMEGYGLYWYCLELIAASVDRNNLTFELEHDAELIAIDVSIHQDVVQEIMTFMVGLGLFEAGAQGIVTCRKMALRTDEYTKHLMRNFNNVPRVSRESPETLGRNSRLIEENRREQNRTEENIKEKENPPAAAASSVPRGTRVVVPYQKIVDLWNQVVPELPQPVKLTPARKTQIRARWNDELPDLDAWRECFGLVKSSQFLMGRVDPVNGRKRFRATLDWISKQENLVKLYEGKYHSE